MQSLKSCSGVDGAFNRQRAFLIAFKNRLISPVDMVCRPANAGFKYRGLAKNCENEASWAVRLTEIDMSNKMNSQRRIKQDFNCAGKLTKLK